MLYVARALYREPVLFIGALIALGTALTVAGVVGWPAVVAVAVLTFIQRHFATPAKPAPGALEDAGSRKILG